MLWLPGGDPSLWLAALLGLALSAHIITTLASSSAASSVPLYSSPIVLVVGSLLVQERLPLTLTRAYPAPPPRLPRADAG